MCKLDVNNFSIKLVLICSFTWVTRVSNAADGYKCNAPAFEIPTWNFSTSLPPANITLSLNSSTNELNVVSKNVEIYFCFSIFVLPFVKDQSECPSVIEKSMDIRRFWTSFDSKGCEKDNNFSIKFHKVITGCYYFVMSNEYLNETWQWEPKFYNTSYPFYDTKVRVSKRAAERKDEWIKPGDSTTPRHMYIPFEIPLNCMEVITAVFELGEDIPSAVAMLEIRKRKIPATQKYAFVKTGKNKVNTVAAVSPLITDIKLNVSVLEDKSNDEGWTALLRWTKLGSKSGTYYVYYAGNYNTKPCFERYDPTNLKTWRLLDENNWTYLGKIYKEETPPMQIPDQSTTILSVGIFCVVSVLLILAFWMVKYSRLIRARDREGNDTVERSPPITLHELSLSNRIALIYVKGSLQFMEGLDGLRRCLKQDCQCELRDMFDTKELGIIAELGPCRWVEELLRSGSRVVWVDTPQFRSRLNDPKMEEDAGDFRELAVPYAVALAIDLFQNSATQYIRHFVVRMKGFEVKDHRDDPLLVVSPHTRYHIPENLPQLCEDL